MIEVPLTLNLLSFIIASGAALLLAEGLRGLSKQNRKATKDIVKHFDDLKQAMAALLLASLAPILSTAATINMLLTGTNYVVLISFLQVAFLALLAFTGLKMYNISRHKRR